MNYIESLREELQEFDALNSMLDSIEENIYLEEAYYNMAQQYAIADEIDCLDYIYSWESIPFDKVFWESYDKAMDEIKAEEFSNVNDVMQKYNNVKKALEMQQFIYLSTLMHDREYREIYEGIMDGYTAAQEMNINL